MNHLRFMAALNRVPLNLIRNAF